MLRTFLLLWAAQLMSIAQLAAQISESEDWPYRNYPAHAITVPSWRFAHGPHVRAAFRKVVAAARVATVEVRVDGVRKAYGGVVDSRGWILTKASALRGKISCLFADGREFDASEHARSSEYDLALLHIDAEGLKPLEFHSDSQLVVGSWVATVGEDSYPVGVGVVSVEPREIEHQAGVLGIALDPSAKSAKIFRVFPGSAASRAGLLTNDVLVSINGQSIETREALIDQVRRYNPGDRVSLAVERSGRQFELSATLMGRFPGMLSRAEFQNQLGGDLSERRFGFPSAFQHDTPIDPEDCGGPVVDLSGKVVGFNISRSGRTETYAIGNESLRKVLSSLLPAEVQQESGGSTAVGQAIPVESNSPATTPLESAVVPAVP